ncbi:MAG: AraC family transcriptional regulator, partial [Gorillibacterium sp.]|nr:AraC family transcriptional regulator [Gorillibacterium sp.]
LYCDRTLQVDLNDLIGRCETFIQYCQQYFYCKVSCYIGKKNAIEHTKLGYETLLKMEYDNITKSHAVHLHQPKREEPNHFPAVDLSEWTTLIEQGDETNLRERIHQSLTVLKFAGGNQEALLIYYHSVLQTIYSVLHRRGKYVQEVFTEGGILDSSSVPKTISQMEDWAIKVVEVVMRYVKTAEDSIVHQVKVYINTHLDERIERMELAELVHLNPAYLSRLFKKETGTSLSEYILSEKMKLTKQLLRNTNKPISEIAQIAGYSNLSYFSKTFKKMFNVSPMSYRKDIN